MAKIFNGKVLFASAMQPTGAQPLDDRVVVQSYSDLVDVTTFGDAKYLGMIVGVVDDSKLYMLTNTDVTAEGAWKEIGAGGAVSVETYAEAVALASDENIGQVIYVKTKSSYDADGEGEGAAVEYDAAPYIVIGTGSLQKLAASTASGDIEGDVAELKTKVSGIETAVGDASNGLVKDVADLKGAVEALPETFVTDVKDANGNSLVAGGVATLGDYATKSELESAIDLKADASSVYAKSETYTQLEVNNLLADKADASDVYTKTEVDGAIEDVINQIPEVPFQSVAEGDTVLKLNNGVLSSTLSYGRGAVNGEDSLVLKGIDGVVIGSVPVADFIADGMLESVEPKEEGSNIFVFTFNSAAGSKSFEVDFSKYVDTYNADNETLELDSTNNTFKVKDGVFEVAGAADEALTAAKTYVDGSIAAVNTKIDTKLDNTIFETYKTTNDAAVAKKVEQSAYDEKVATLEDAIKTKADADTLNSYATIANVDASLALKADVATVVKGVSLNGVDGKFENNNVALTIDLSGYAEKTSVDVSLALKADKGDFDALVNKVGHDATGDASATGLFADIASLRADLYTKASSSALTEGLAAKLDKSATVNGVKFNESGAVVIDAADITLDSAIVRGETEVYAATNSIQTVLANLSSRIDTLDPNISGEFGVSAVDAGDGISITGSASNPTVSVAIDESTVKFANKKVAVKVSDAADNMLTVNENGLYVAKSVPTWESIS